MPIIDRKTRLKVRRIVRRQKRQVEGVVTETDAELDRLVMRRLNRLVRVRRFVAVWLALLVMLGLGALWQVRALDKFYLTNAPVQGGTYREGIIGAFTNANPLFATSSVDASVSRLLFSGLFKVSPSGDLFPDLAEDLNVDENAKKFTIKLREDVYWHDGEQFSADDVIYTYETIQLPEARSPLRSSWLGVKLEKIDDFEVVFTLPSSFSSFPFALINGIVPEHILGPVDLPDLRSSSFNTVEPVGTGPFKFKNLEVVGDDTNSRQELIALTKNQDYRGTNAGLDGVVIVAYRDEIAMINDFKDQELKSMVGLTSLPEEFQTDPRVQQITSPLTSSVMLFLNNSNFALSDKSVRQALVQATDTKILRQAIEYSAVPTDSPFLRSQFAYDETRTQLEYNIEEANRLLDEAGWLRNDKGIRVKDERPLTLRLVSQSLSEYSSITQKVQESWLKIGADVEVNLLPENEIQGGVIARHDYDVLLYGISIGYDPDVFAYWHSTQADINAPIRLNLSEFQNATADEALEAGRTRTDEALRKIKYQPFLDVWREEAPAIALYQPRFLMVVRGTFEGYESGQLSTATDRYYSITNWKIRNDQVVKE